MSLIKGKVVAITGASSGIGKATAQLLAERGAKVVLGARRLDRLQTLAEQIQAAGGEAVAVETDVTKRDQVAHLVKIAQERFGRLDVLISNAGIGRISRFDELKVDDWEAMIDVNLRAVLYGIAAALPVFQSQKSGHFINVISTSGIRIISPQGVYAATKNAVRTLAEVLRQEAGPSIRVTGVSPGYVHTEIADHIEDPEVRAATAKRMEEFALPPEAIARAIAYAIEQPTDVDVGDIVIRPTAQD